MSMASGSLKVLKQTGKVIGVVALAIFALVVVPVSIALLLP